MIVNEKKQARREDMRRLGFTSTKSYRRYVKTLRMIRKIEGDQA